MAGKKRFGIGITVNLDNYENIRLEAEGEVETEEDAMELISFIDGVLGEIGRGDERTRSKIESYRSRVLSSATRRGGVPVEEAVPSPVEPREPAAVQSSPPGAGAATGGAVTEDKGRTEPPAVDVCEECGAPVTAAQKKVSQMFLGRTLCRKCMPTM
ncbi:MAG: hypothetical protein ACXQTG_04970 [Methanoculleaceae archaeon]